MNRLRFYLLLCLALFLSAAVAACAWWFHPDTRQNRLDAQLFVAINHDNTPAAVRLLDQGANPNAHSEIGAAPPSFLQWIRENVLFRRVGHSAPKYVFSAFDAALFQPSVGNPDIVLATALLEHGARLTNPYGASIGVATNSYSVNMPPTVATLEMPDGGTSWQNTTAVVPLVTLIQVIEFKGTPQQIDAFVQAALKAGAFRRKL